MGTISVFKKQFDDNKVGTIYLPDSLKTNIQSYSQDFENYRSILAKGSHKENKETFKSFMRDLFKRLQKELENKSMFRNLAVGLGSEQLGLKTTLKMDNLLEKGTSEAQPVKRQISNPLSTTASRKEFISHGKNNIGQGSFKSRQINNQTLQISGPRLNPNLKTKSTELAQIQPKSFSKNPVSKSEEMETSKAPGRRSEKSKKNRRNRKRRKMRKRQKALRKKFTNILKKIAKKVSKAIRKEQKRVLKGNLKPKDILSKRMLNKLKKSTWKILKMLKSSKFKKSPELKKLTRILKQYMLPNITQIPTQQGPSPHPSPGNPTPNQHHIFPNELDLVGDVPHINPSMIAGDESPEEDSHIAQHKEVARVRLRKRNPLVLFKRLLLKELNGRKKIK